MLYLLDKKTFYDDYHWTFMIVDVPGNLSSDAVEKRVTDIYEAWATADKKHWEQLESLEMEFEENNSEPEHHNDIAMELWLRHRDEYVDSKLPPSPADFESRLKNQFPEARILNFERIYLNDHE